MSEIPQYVVDLATQVASDLDLAFLDAASIHAESLKEAEDDAILRIANAIVRGIELYRQSQADAAHPMTATPSETPEAHLSDERLREIIDGCKGVTPGPWKRYERTSAAETRVHSDKHEVCTIHWERNGLEETAHRDGEYLARLDPDTVRALATELLARRTQPSAGEVVTRALGDADEISARIVKGGYRANLSDVETLRNHVRKLAASAAPPDQSRVERLEAALRSMVGAFDTPVARRQLNTDFANEARTLARQALHGDRS